MTSLLASSWCAFSTSQPSYSLRCQYVQVFLPPHVRCLLPWMPPLLFAGLIWQHIQHMHMYIIHILDYNSLCVQILRIFKMFASKSSHSNSTVNWVTVVTYIFFLFLGGGGRRMDYIIYLNSWTGHDASIIVLLQNIPVHLFQYSLILFPLIFRWLNGIP